MNKSFASLVALIIAIAIFGVVVMTNVPRRDTGATAINSPVVGSVDSSSITLAKTDLGFSELPDGHGGTNAESIA